MVSTSMLGFISLSTQIAGILDCRLGKPRFLNTLGEERVMYSGTRGEQNTVVLRYKGGTEKQGC